MDWSGCNLVESVEGRRSGVPTVVGTRVFPETPVMEHDAGMTVAQIMTIFQVCQRR